MDKNKYSPSTRKYPESVQKEAGSRISIALDSICFYFYGNYICGVTLNTTAKDRCFCSISPESHNELERGESDF